LHLVLYMQVMSNYAALFTTVNETKLFSIKLVKFDKLGYWLLATGATRVDGLILDHTIENYYCISSSVKLPTMNKVKGVGIKSFAVNCPAQRTV